MFVKMGKCHIWAMFGSCKKKEQGNITGSSTLSSSHSFSLFYLAQFG